MARLPQQHLFREDAPCQVDLLHGSKNEYGDAVELVSLKELLTT